MTIPIFHDIGKVNPNFQLMKLKVNDFKENEAYVNTHHSFYHQCFIWIIVENLFMMKKMKTRL